MSVFCFVVSPFRHFVVSSFCNFLVPSFRDVIVSFCHHFVMSSFRNSFASNSSLRTFVALDFFVYSSWFFFVSFQYE